MLESIAKNTNEAMSTDQWLILKAKNAADGAKLVKRLEDINDFFFDFNSVDEKAGVYSAGTVQDSLKQEMKGMTKEQYVNKVEEVAAKLGITGVTVTVMTEREIKKDADLKDIASEMYPDDADESLNEDSAESMHKAGKDLLDRIEKAKDGSPEKGNLEQQYKDFCKKFKEETGQHYGTYLSSITESTKLSRRLPTLNEEKASAKDKAAKLLSKGDQVVITGGHPDHVGKKAVIEDVYDASKGDKPGYLLKMDNDARKNYDYDQVKSKDEVNAMATESVSEALSPEKKKWYADKKAKLTADEKTKLGKEYDEVEQKAQVASEKEPPDMKEIGKLKTRAVHIYKMLNGPDAEPEWA